MQRGLILAGTTVALAGAVFGASRGLPCLHSRSSAAVSQAPAAPELPATRIEFREFFDGGPKLQVSSKLRALDGQRVRIAGFMAQMEIPPKGGFFLTPRPVRCDEAGGGTADLPPEALFVIARSVGDKPVPFMSDALEVAGVLEVGNRADADGRVSAFRLRLDGPGALPQQSSSSASL